MDRESNISERTTGERPALEPPRFSLATLFWIIAGLGVLFGLMTAAGPLGGFAMLLFVLVLIAHVAGNSIGTRLREFGNEKVEEDHPLRKSRGEEDARRAAAPASNLSLGGSVSLTMLVFTIAGAALVGSTGSALLIWLTWSKLNVATTIIAVVSPTVLGGIVGFAISSFTQTASGAWREASDSYSQEKRRRIQEMTNAATSGETRR